VPPSPQVVAQLATRYESRELGHIDVRKDSSGVVFDVGLWGSHVASRKNADGTTSFITIDPGVDGFFDFVVASANGKAELITQDGQHKYVYTAQTNAASR
jgi:hypothetical protein